MPHIVYTYSRVHDVCARCSVTKKNYTPTRLCYPVHTWASKKSLAHILSHYCSRFTEEVHKSSMRRRDDGGAAAWKSSTSRALSKVCRKRWRTLPLAAGSPTPPMRINCANGEDCHCGVFKRTYWYIRSTVNASPCRRATSQTRAPAPH